MTAPRFMLVDDDVRVRSRLRRMIEDEFPTASVTEAGSAEEALSLAESGQFSLILLDNSLPGRKGIQALPDLRASQPDADVVMVSGMPEDQYGPAAMRAGAAAFVSKESVPDALLPLLHRLIGTVDEDVL